MLETGESFTVKHYSVLDENNLLVMFLEHLYTCMNSTGMQ